MQLNKEQTPQLGGTKWNPSLPDEGSLDHVVPRSRGGPDTRENFVWSSKQVNTRKGNRLPHEAGLKLLNEPPAPKELPVTALLQPQPVGRGY